MTCRLAGVGKSVFEVVVSSWARAWSLDLSRWGVGRSFAATVSTVPGHRRYRLCQWLRYRLQRERRRYRLCQWRRYRRCYAW